MRAFDSRWLVVTGTVLATAAAGGHHAFGQAAPQTAARSGSYDGTYAGQMTLAQDNAAGQRGVFHGRLRGCTVGPFQKTLTMRGGQFSFLYNNEQQLRIVGAVAPDGALSGSTTSTAGFIVLSARISGNDLVGTMGGSYCSYALQLRRS